MVRRVLAAASLLAGAAVLLALTATAAVAQSETGVLAGTVRGDDGNRLPGVVVTVDHKGTGLRRTATTDEDGHYVLSLPINSGYTVQAELTGFSGVTSQDVAMTRSGTIVDFTLRVTLLEAVAVTATSPLQQETQSTLQQTVTDHLVHSLPVVSRSFLSLASLAAGFTGNPNFPSPQGQLHWTNNIIVDGASHFSKWRSAPRTLYSGYTLESIRDVQVLTNRFSAEYGEALGAVTSATTRSGDREFHGSTLLFVQDSTFNEPPEFAPDNPPSSSQRYGLTLGGPLTVDRDHTRFLQSYEGWRSRTQNAVVAPAAGGATVPDDQDEHLIFFRIDHRSNPRHFIMTRYSGQFLRWHNERGGLDLPGTGISYTNDVHTWLTTDRRDFGAGWLNDLRVQFSRFVNMRRDLDPTVFVSEAGVSQRGGTTGPFGFGADPEDTWEAANIASRITGRHSLKIGGGLKYVRDHNPSLTYGHGAYFFSGAQPYLFVQSLAPTPQAAVADPRSVSAFGFFQDDWRVDAHTTANIGVRYDVERIGNVRNYTASTDVTNVQPRFGMTWRPLDRTIIRGGFGLYTQQHLLYQINRVQLEGADGAVVLSLAPGSALFPRFPSVLSLLPPGGLYPPRDVSMLDSTFRNPYSVQATIGVEQNIRRVSIAADYVFLNGRDLMSLLDFNAPSSNVKPAQRSVAAADATRPAGAVPGGFRKVITLGNKGESWYHALQLKASRSIGRFQAMGSYTLAHAEDMLNYELPEDSRNTDAERARANTDVRHSLTAGATWTIPDYTRWLSNLTLSGIGSFRSSRPYTVSWGDDRNGTTQNDARPGGRNTARTGTFQNVDLALTKSWRVGAKIVEGRAETFNIFNTANYDEYVGALLSPFYGQPVTAFPKRRFQFAGIVRF